MAKLYKKSGSKKWWIRYRDLPEDKDAPSDGRPLKWKGRSTGFKIDSTLEKPRIGSATAKAIQLLDITDAQESNYRNNLVLKGTLPTRSNHPWNEWAPKLIYDLYYNPATNTYPSYRGYWKNMMRFFDERGITHPGLVDSDALMDYLPWRQKDEVCVQTVKKGIQLLTEMLDYACDKHWIPFNPARSRWLLRKLDNAAKTETVNHAKPWSDHQVDTVRDALARDPYGWMNMSFQIALFHGIRHTQTQPRLDDIYLNTGHIDYIYFPGQTERNGMPFNLVKRVGKKTNEDWGYVQPILEPFKPILTDFVAHRKSLGEESLLDLPRHSQTTQFGAGKAPYEWRKFLDKLGFSDITFHGLRARWITISRENGVEKALSMRFVNHKSEKVHDMYTHLTPDYDPAALNAIAHRIAHI